ncbi:MAG TPA: hypothetical protein VFE24_01630 [Pirellulales bacterium]|jgi:Spy/CpxP family protein refolding chaperone|nr:hypothetical protein [Pirellulales bacterium]
MSRLFSGLLAVCVPAVLVLVATSPAHAQRQGGRGQGGGFGQGGGGQGNLNTVSLEQVQKELELSDEQKESLKKLGTDIREQARANGGNRQSLRDLSQEDRDKKLAEMRDKAKEQAADVNKKINDILLPAQQTRLKEIALQLKGTNALMDDEVQTSLGLSDDQKTQLKTASEASRTAMRDLFQGGQGNAGNRDEIRTKIADARKSSDEKMLAVLTSDQKDKFEKMQGKKIDIDRNALFGNRGNRGNRGNQNNNDKKTL